MKYIVTEDGSHTLYSPVVEECYHSQHGAIQESQHIFIESAWKQCTKTEVAVLEVGLGTGLNAFLTMLMAQNEHKIVHYTSLELYPLPLEMALGLNYAEQLGVAGKVDFEKLHRAEWESRQQITPYFLIEKKKLDFTLSTLEGQQFDLVYFDAFSPDKQPEMWTQERFEMLYKCCNPDAVLTTYCAKGCVRRAMQAAGFVVERLPGPPGKREILRGRKIS